MFPFCFGGHQVNLRGGRGSVERDGLPQTMGPLRGRPPAGRRNARPTTPGRGTVPLVGAARVDSTPSGCGRKRRDARMTMTLAQWIHLCKSKGYKLEALSAE